MDEDRVRELVRRRIASRDLNMSELSKAVGKNHAYIQQYLNKGSPKRLPEDVRVKLAPLLDLTEDDLGKPQAQSPSKHENVIPLPQSAHMIPVVGEARAGTWWEPSQVEKPVNNGAPRVGASPTYPVEAQYLLRIAGNSMSRVIKPGEYVHCVEIHNYDHPIADGDIVHVERIRDDGGLHEVTIKRYRVRNGQRELWPDSDDKDFQDPVLLDNGEEGIVCEIRGVVLHVIRAI